MILGIVIQHILENASRLRLWKKTCAKTPPNNHTVTNYTFHNTNIFSDRWCYLLGLPHDGSELLTSSLEDCAQHIPQNVFIDTK